MYVNEWSIYVRTAFYEQLMKPRLKTPYGSVRPVPISILAPDQAVDSDKYLQRMRFTAYYRHSKACD